VLSYQLSTVKQPLRGSCVFGRRLRRNLVLSFQLSTVKWPLRGGCVFGRRLRRLNLPAAG
jgi:hypothetical protein